MAREWFRPLARTHTHTVVIISRARLGREADRARVDDGDSYIRSDAPLLMRGSHTVTVSLARAPRPRSRSAAARRAARPRRGAARAARRGRRRRAAGRARASRPGSVGGKGRSIVATRLWRRPRRERRARASARRRPSAVVAAQQRACRRQSHSCGIRARAMDSTLEPAQNPTTRGVVHPTLARRMRRFTRDSTRRLVVSPWPGCRARAARRRAPSSRLRRATRPRGGGRGVTEAVVEV